MRPADKQGARSGEPGAEGYQEKSEPLPDSIGTSPRQAFLDCADRLSAFRCLDVWLSELVELSARSQLRSDCGLTDDAFDRLLAEVDSFGHCLAAVMQGAAGAEFRASTLPRDARSKKPLGDPILPDDGDAPRRRKEGGAA
jgi:hypothetical protein